MMLRAMICLVWIGCAHPSADDAQPVITLKRTACYGSCPMYEVSIYGDGQVEYIGKGFVAVEGTIHSRVAVDSLHVLLHEATRIRYFDLQDNYEGRIINDSLTEMVSDLPSTITSVRIEDRKKTINDYYGGPDQLHAFERHIDAVANTKQWIGKGGR